VESLVEYIEEGYTLESHDDVPEHIRQELYTTANHSLEARKKSASISASITPPVTINILPAFTCRNCSAESIPTADLMSRQCPIRAPVVPIDIPGYLAEQVLEYCAWQQSLVQESV
jgi:hypothetical protein